MILTGNDFDSMTGIMRANVQCAILSGQFHIIAWKISIPVGSLVSSLGICTGKLLASFWGTYRYSQSYYRYLIILEKPHPGFAMSKNSFILV